MNKKPWVDILRENIEDGSNISDEVAQCFLNELKLVKAQADGNDLEIAGAEYMVHLDEGGIVH